MRRYFFDMTDLRGYLVHHDTLTGIQRVVVMAAAQARRNLGVEPVWLCYFDSRSGAYLACQPTKASSLDLSNIQDLRTVLDVPIAKRTLPGMEKYHKRRTRRALKMALLDLAAWLGREKPFRRIGSTATEWRALRTQTPVVQRADIIRTTFGEVRHKGDCLLLIDNTLRLQHVEHHFAAAKDAGVEVIALLHDLIPIVTPHFTRSDAPDWLFQWLKRSLGYVSRYLANSENTARDLRLFLKTQGAEHSVHTVPLAQAPVAASEAGDGSLSQAERDAFPVFADSRGVSDRVRGLRKTSFVLTVGTQEIRKNLWGLARAWQTLQLELGADVPKLVVVGRQGWLNDDFDAVMRSTGNLGGWVEILDDVDDAGISWLYRNCLFTVCTSFYEGWGLPVGESLAYGKTAVVSQVASLPEVGRDMVLYCDPESVQSIAEACKTLITDHGARQALEDHIRATPLRSWSDVADDLLEAARPADGAL